MAPNLFAFPESANIASMLCRIIGLLVLGQALLTDYELGLVRVIPMKTHLTIDYVMMAFLAASPWMFGFANQPPAIWVTPLAVGVGGFLLSLMTETAPRLEPVQRDIRL